MAVGETVNGATPSTSKAREPRGLLPSRGGTLARASKARRNRRFGTARRGDAVETGRSTAKIAGLVPSRGAALARSEVWYRDVRKFWRNRAIWYLLVAKSQVWYPPSGGSRSLVPKKAAQPNCDQAFLRASGTKSPKLAEIRDQTSISASANRKRASSGTKPPIMASHELPPSGRGAGAGAAGGRAGMQVPQGSVGWAEARGG